MAARQDEIFSIAARCLREAGSEGFFEPFFALVRAGGADQVMAFEYDRHGVRCQMSRNFIEGALGQRLAEDYLAVGHEQDPLRRRLAELPEGGRSLHRMADILDEMAPEYRARFFAAPRLTNKVTVLLAEGRRLAVSLYWRAGGGPSDGLALMIAELAAAHVCAAPESAHPAPLTALSPRERAICLGVLAGKKTEEIAHDLGVAPSSVATYRSRAYAKLGVNSRGALFAMCREPIRPAP